MDFKYGNLIIKCHQCGEEQLIEELVTDGRCLYLFNKDDSYIKLHCPKCDITMEMRIIPDVEANAEYADDLANVEMSVVNEDEIVVNEELQENSPSEETI